MEESIPLQLVSHICFVNLVVKVEDKSMLEMITFVFEVISIFCFIAYAWFCLAKKAPYNGKKAVTIHAWFCFFLIVTMVLCLLGNRSNILAWLALVVYVVWLGFDLNELYIRKTQSRKRT